MLLARDHSFVLLARDHSFVPIRDILAWWTFSTEPCLQTYNRGASL